jgi:phosphoglycolate phosphatase
MRGVLFDKDGTLLDFEASWSGVYRELCLDLADGDAAVAQSMLVAGGLDPATGRFRSGGPLAAGNTIDIVRIWFPGLSYAAERAMIERIDRVFHMNGIKCSVPVPGLRETLATLADEGYAMGVATSDGTASARAALAALGLSDFFPHVFGYDSVKNPKPAPDIVRAFSKATRLKASDIVVIGDNPHDIEMARSAGAGAALGVLTGNSGRDDLAPLADAVLASVCELPRWLEEQGNRGVRQ